MTAHPRLTIRQQAFTEYVLRGHSPTKAYGLAGFEARGNAASVNAARLMRLAKVQAHMRSQQAQIDEARQRAQAAVMIVTAQTVSNMLASVFENATKDKQHGAAATAAMGLAKVHGLLVDKTEDVTRRAARSPDAPIEIEVEHWLTEQQGLPSPSPEVRVEPAQRDAESDHGPEPESLVPEGTETQGSEREENLKGSEVVHEVQRKDQSYQ